MKEEVGLFLLIIGRFGCVCGCDFVVMMWFFFVVVENGLKEEMGLFLSAGVDVHCGKVWLCLWFCCWLCLWFCCEGEDFIFFGFLFLLSFCFLFFLDFVDFFFFFFFLTFCFGFYVLFFVFFFK